MRVVLAGGGTAGHVEPALAIATQLIADGYCQPAEIYFIGGYRGLEGKLVPKQGFLLHQLDISGVPRGFGFELMFYPFKLWRARKNLLKFFREVKPDLVVGFGGYVAAPAYLAAKAMNIPLVIHEANALAGVANQRAAKFAAKVIESYPNTINGAVLIGVPVKQSLLDLNIETANHAARSFFNLPQVGKVLLVFGGSQGAEQINQALSQIAEKLSQLGIHVIHIAGELNYAKYRELTVSGPGSYLVIPYCEEMEKAYAAADLVVSRAGALTVAELAAVGLPAILVPYPVGNGEQALNAKPIVAAGGAILLLNQDCTPQKLLTLIQTNINDDQKLATLRLGASRVANRNATAEIVKILNEVGR